MPRILFGKWMPKKEDDQDKKKKKKQQKKPPQRKRMRSLRSQPSGRTTLSQQNQTLGKLFNRRKLIWEKVCFL